MRPFKLTSIPFAVFLLFLLFPANANELPGGGSDEKGEDGEGGLRTIQHQAFQAGEVLKYRVRYGWIHAGEAVVKVKETDKEVRGRDLLHMVGKGRSRGSFDWFYKVRDRYETYVDKKGVFPWVFIRRVNEDGYEIEQDYTFFQRKNKVQAEHRGTSIDGVKKGTYETPDAVQDIFSSFYYARTLDFSNAEPGTTYEINCFLDENLYPFQIKYLGRDTVETKYGRFSTHKFCPVVQEGRIFKDEDDLQVWVTDDGNNVPVLARARIIVGSIKMELKHWEGLANPISRLDE